MLTRSPELFTAPQGEALREARSEQIGALLSHGVHRLYNVTREEFRRLIPDFLPQPAEYSDRFYIPLVVAPVSIKDFCNLLNIGDDGRERAGKLANSTSVPRKPYTIWTHDGSRYAGFAGEQALRLFRGDEEASPLEEVFALAIQYPELFNPQILAPGTSRDVGFWQLYLVKSREMPRVNLDRGSNRFAVWTVLHNRSFEYMGILSRGRQINVAA